MTLAFIKSIRTPSARLLLLAVFAWNVYEALHLPVTRDEAYEFVHFVRPPLRDVVRQFDPRDQVLHTLLVKRSVGLFRLSEFSMRVPALLAVGFFFWVVFRVGRGSPVIAGLLVLNPFVQGHLWAAAGDAMGLALFAWGVDRVIQRRLNFAGLLLGLSMAASLVFAIPVAVLIAACLAIGHDRWAVIERLALTTLAAAFILLAIPLSRIESKQPKYHTQFSLKSPDYRYLDIPPRTQQQVRLAVSPELVPTFEFYKARYRLNNLQVEPDGTPDIR
jgi:hypothetical protein